MRTGGGDVHRLFLRRGISETTRRFALRSAPRSNQCPLLRASHSELPHSVARVLCTKPTWSPLNPVPMEYTYAEGRPPDRANVGAKLQGPSGGGWGGGGGLI